jgi:AraC-like DNA-binding protein
MVKVDIERWDIPAAGGWEAHAHDDEALLSYAAEGSCTQIMADRSWMVLPAHAVWMPPGVVHGTLASPRGCRLVTVRFPVPIPADLPRECCVIEVSPLLASLVRAWEASAPDDEARLSSLRFLIYDEVRRAVPQDLGLPRVRDPRLLRVTDALQNDPTDPRGLDALARVAGMSRRSFIRHFQTQAGMGFAEWRRRLRLLMTRQMMAEGVPVTEAAMALGYGSASAYIAMVRRELGVTPKRLAGQIAGSAVARSASR